MGKVFLSHASGDIEVAQQIVQGLEASNVQCWIAPRNIPTGVAYAEALFEALRACGAVVVVCSDKANSSGHVSRELEVAARFAKKIIPLVLNDHQPTGGMGYLLAGLQQIKLTFGAYSAVVAALVRELRNSSPAQEGEFSSACVGLLEILETAGLTPEESRRIVLSMKGAIEGCQTPSPGATISLMHVFQRLPSMDAPELEETLRQLMDRWLASAYVGESASPHLLWPKNGDDFGRGSMDVVRRSFHNSGNIRSGGLASPPTDDDLVVDYCVRPGVVVHGPAHEPGGTVPAWVAVSLRKS